MNEINNFDAGQKILKFNNKLDLFFNKHKTLVTIELDITNKCNNDCPGCTGVRDNPVELKFEQVSDLVDQLKDDFNLKSIIISGGGEPLLHKDFVDILYYIRNKGISIGLNSNGVSITEDKARAILDCCEYFRVSLDAGSPEMYLLTHGDNERIYNKVLSGIELVSKMKKNMCSSTSFGVGFLTNESTKKDIESFVNICKDRGVDFAQLRPFTNDFTNIEEEYQYVKKKYSSKSFRVVSSSHKFSHFADEDKRPYKKCYGMFFNTVVTADYKVFACLHHRQKDKYFIGDLHNNSLKDLWLSSRIVDVYNGIDFCDCPFFCRNDDINRSLFGVDTDVSHVEFL